MPALHFLICKVFAIMPHCRCACQALPPQIGKLFNKCASAVSSNKQAVYKYANADFSNALVVPRMCRRRFANWQRHGRIFYLLRLKIFLMQWNIEH